MRKLLGDMNLSIDEVSHIENYINYMSVISLEAIIYSDDDDLTIMETLEDKDSISPEESLENKERVEILEKAIDKLKEKDKLVLNLYYYEKLTLKEIGQILEVSESRVSQLHSRAIRNLRAIMQKINYI